MLVEKIKKYIWI